MAEACIIIPLIMFLFNSFITPATRVPLPCDYCCSLLHSHWLRMSAFEFAENSHIPYRIVNHPQCKCGSTADDQQKKGLGSIWFSCSSPMLNFWGASPSGMARPMVSNERHIQPCKGIATEQYGWQVSTHSNYCWIQKSSSCG